MLDRQKGAVQIDGLLAAPAFESHRRQLAADPDPRAMDQRVDAAQRAARVCRRRDPVLLVGDVQRRRRGHADRAGDGGQSDGVDVAAQHAGALRLHDPGAGEAYPAGGSRDQDALS